MKYVLKNKIIYLNFDWGLRSIATSYSKIGFEDIKNKLGLASNEEAEFVIAKAVSDGVIDARIDREKQCMLSQTKSDLYCSSEPQKQLYINYIDIFSQHFFFWQNNLHFFESFSWHLFSILNQNSNYKWQKSIGISE